MRIPNVPNREPSQSVRLPRRMVLIVVPVLFLLVHVALPWAISFLSTRHGWAQRRPGRGNLLALLLVGAGTSCILWCESLHLAASPGSIEMERTPRHLLVRGPYTFTRNPMYLSALTIWLGWALFYGSFAVFVACAVGWVLVTFLVVPWEERELEARFGEAYLQYKNTVPRWFGKTGR
jgi:protein-S-isoprenylcysteine O-methyltransferase Ste14